ncbi:gelsolin protein 1 [Biomphalaria glabrata]|nr:gelsolin protein 1 [Biomphalaria glabrata]
MQGIVEERHGKQKAEVLDEGAEDGDFLRQLNEQHEEEHDFVAADRTVELFRLSDASETTVSEKKNALSYAHLYLQKTDHPLVPASCLSEGRVVKAFEAAIAA